jgi:antitoxin VapB
LTSGYRYTKLKRHVALNIKNAEVERLATEVASLEGTSKTSAILEALKERRAKLARQQARSRRLQEIREFLESEVWVHTERGRARGETDDDLLGYGPGGV